MVGTKSPSSVDPTYLRKIRKPMVEKRRRDRMNNSLAQLKSLLAVNVKHNSSTSLSRLDKADILELTVSQLTSLQNQQRSISLATDVDGYKRGFKDCARETIRYLTATQSLDTDSLFRVNNHLQSFYLEKTRGTPNVSHRTDAPSAHVSTKRSDIRQAIDQSFYGLVTHPSVPQTIPGAHGQNYSDYQFYHLCNDSVDTSLNSSGNMSLDSSSSVTPEKVVPYESTEDDMWRPW